MDVITGKTRPDSGSVFLGQDIDLLKHDEAEIARLGIGRKFQKPTVFPALSVHENLTLALERALNYIAAAGATLTDHSEVAADELRLAQVALGEVTGEFTSDDLLGEIFSSFCIGK